MIAHVAEAGEQRGRVVLRLSASERPRPMALEAAVAVARAFGSEMEALFVEDPALFALAAYPGAREIAFSGGDGGPLSPAIMEARVKALASAVLRDLERLGRRADVRVHRRVVRQDPFTALAAACAQNGPWNVVALSETLRANHAPELSAIFSDGVDMTGVVMAGPAACRTSGPVAAVVEDIDRLPSALRAAERLSSVTGGDVRLLLVGQNDDEAAWLDSQARLLMTGYGRVAISSAVASVGARAMLDALHKVRCGFLVAHFGGILLPVDGDLGLVASSLECPLFLAR